MLDIVAVLQGLAQQRLAKGNTGDGLLVTGRRETVRAEDLGGEVVRSLEVLVFQLGNGNLGTVGQLERLGTGSVGRVGRPGSSTTGIAQPIVALGLGATVNRLAAGRVIHPDIHHLGSRRRSALHLVDGDRFLVRFIASEEVTGAIVHKNAVLPFELAGNGGFTVIGDGYRETAIRLKRIFGKEFIAAFDSIEIHASLRGEGKRTGSDTLGNRQDLDRSGRIHDITIRIGRNSGTLAVVALLGGTDCTGGSLVRDNHLISGSQIRHILHQFEHLVLHLGSTGHIHREGTHDTGLEGLLGNGNLFFIVAVLRFERHLDRLDGNTVRRYGKEDVRRFFGGQVHQVGGCILLESLGNVLLFRIEVPAAGNRLIESQGQARNLCRSRQVAQRHLAVCGQMAERNRHRFSRDGRSRSHGQEYLGCRIDRHGRRSLVRGKVQRQGFVPRIGTNNGGTRRNHIERPGAFSGEGHVFAERARLLIGGRSDLEVFERIGKTYAHSHFVAILPQNRIFAGFSRAEGSLGLRERCLERDNGVDTAFLFHHRFLARSHCSGCYSHGKNGTE